MLIFKNNNNDEKNDKKICNCSNTVPKTAAALCLVFSFKKFSTIAYSLHEFYFNAEYLL